ncbi:YceD family protein [Aureimonas leprariae]|uniref:DUF177 domain-containing protein n=1 Tax=Plantimonas leprariae TaxID=2615207 RepID=A0A7V7TWY8_9HYPH|nr:DUF177 domain-containing protein [Aureimonas leprariae]KAB0680716.1 DUF177 domain-containing protein [Aureimonas leprariae]
MSEGQAPDAPVFALVVSRLPQDGLRIRFEADEAQRRAIAARFGILGVERFEAELLARRWQDDGVAVDGTLFAATLQPDVVTLDPVRQDIEEEVTLFFVPEHSRLARPAVAEDDAIDLDPGDEAIETFRGDRIDLGEPLVQLLGVALDPYPRGEDVSFEAVREGEREPSPFAVLARLREPKKD